MQITRELREKVHEAYSAAAERPGEAHPFPVGREFAESLGYPRELLAGTPPACVEAFAGVSNVSIFAEIPAGATVLDIGCGAGLDSLIAALRTGPSGKVIGVDFSQAMLARARDCTACIGTRNILFCHADAEHLPLADNSVDVVLVNGIFNLSTHRDSVFQELARVMRPGGRAYVSELILREPLPPEVEASSADWFA